MGFYNYFVQRWPNFRPNEIFSPETRENLTHKLCPISMDTLQEFRNYLDLPLIVNDNINQLRGVRSVQENKNIRNSAEESMHICGRAFDVTAPALTTEALFDAAIAFGKWQGIGMYPTFIHLDTRFLEAGADPVVWSI